MRPDDVFCSALRHGRFSQMCVKEIADGIDGLPDGLAGIHMPLAGQHLQHRIRERFRRAVGIVDRHQRIPVVMKDQHVSGIALRRVDRIEIINAGKIVAPDVQQHMEILFGDFVHTSKELSCVVRQ